VKRADFLDFVFTNNYDQRKAVNIVRVRALAVEDVPGVSQEDLQRCRIPEGMPFLIERDSQEIIEPVFRFLWRRHVRDGNFRSNTALAEADDLKDWFQYLGHFERSWDRASRSDIEQYRDLMFRLISPKTHQKYGEKTVIRRVGTVQEFYRYFNGRGETDVDVGDRLVEVKAPPLDRTALSHLNSGKKQQSNEVLPERQGNGDDEVRAMTARQYRLIAHLLGPTPGLNVNDLRPVRDRLWAELCIHTGLRPGEPENLTIYEILDLSPENPADPLGISYLRIRGKGRKVRKVELPNQVLTWLHWYIEHERETAINEGIRRGHIFARTRPASLFVNHADAGHNAGNPMRYQSFHDAFAAAVYEAAGSGGQSAGLLRTVVKTDPLTKEKYNLNVANFSPHCLRHTFAVWYYLGERQSGNAEPWKALQSLLGHAHMATTVDTYLRVANEFEAMVSDRVTEHFATLLRPGA
jgi:site-specific recombinase XerD